MQFQGESTVQWGRKTTVSSQQMDILILFPYIMINDTLLFSFHNLHARQPRPEQNAFNRHTLQGSTGTQHYFLQKWDVQNCKCYHKAQLLELQNLSPLATQSLHYCLVGACEYMPKTWLGRRRGEGLAKLDTDFHFYHLLHRYDSISTQVYYNYSFPCIAKTEGIYLDENMRI